MFEHDKALRIFRLFFALLGFLSGLLLGHFFLPLLLGLWSRPVDGTHVIIGAVLLAIINAIIFFIITKPLWKGLVLSTNWLETRLKDMPLADLVAATVGLIVGLIVAALFATPLSSLPVIGPYVQLLASLVLGYLGATVGYRWRDRLDQFFSSLLSSRKEKEASPAKSKSLSIAEEGLASASPSSYQVRSKPKVLDTSVIIDGRIVEVCRAGFLEGPLVISSFVLDELRHIADSSDGLKRNRGRRGLDMLNELRELDLELEISPIDYDDIPEVDSKLVRLAKDLDGAVVTNDYNLNKVAAFSQVPVLNVNELAGAIKTIVLPGEEMTVEVVGKGKEAGQGVAYLDDGTMIIVENAAEEVGQTLTTTVTSVIQTNAGRMIFVRPK